MNKLLTIVIPVYNVEKYIYDCLESVRKQTYKAFNVIIVDDGSTDNSINIAKELCNKDNRFKIISKKNGGLSDARNYGLDYVDTKYVTFLDSDDFISINTYEKLINNLETNDNDIVVADIEYYYTNINNNFILKGLNTKVSNDINKQSLLSPMFAWNKVYKLEYFKSINQLYPIGLWYEDIPVTTLLFTNTNKIGYVEEVLYYYRQNDDSIMSQKSKRNEEIFKILEIVIDNFKQRNIYNKYYDEIEYLLIEHTRIYGLYRFLVQDNYKNLYNRSNMFIKTYFPKYKKNKYIKYLGIKNKLFIYTLNKYTLFIYRWYLVRK